MRRYFSEFIGTFALVFFGTGAIIVNKATGGDVSHLGVSVVFGLVVLSMIYSLGDISGAHLNPAVTVAFAVSGRMPFSRVFPYVLAQVSGAVAASGVLRVLFPLSDGYGETLPAEGAMQSFILELILTFFLMLVILCVSTGAKEKGITAGIAIASVVCLEALLGGPISGASMNPARSLAPAVVSGNLHSLWIYLTAPVLGACLAVAASGVLKPGTADPAHSGS